MSLLDDLPTRYRLILCDLWGCVHDGSRLFEGAAERLERWSGEGRTILLVTNAPRSASAVQVQLDRLGLPRSTYRGIVTAGEAGAAALRGRPVGFLGTSADRADLEARGLVFAKAGFTELACAGLNETGSTAEDYRARLEEWAARDVLLHCLNPDRVVIHRGERLACAGAIADLYETLGGRTRWYGKPFASIYDLALQQAGDPSVAEVLAIGDSLATDMAGAARMGFDAVFVSGGIHAGQPFPDDFAAAYGIPGWAPVDVVESLGS